MRTRFKGRTVSVFVIIAAVCAALSAASCGNKRAGRKGIPATATIAPAKRELTPLPVRPLSPALDGMRRRVLPAVAATRELPWRSDAQMSELSGWEYGTRTKELADELGGDELRALGRLAVAGGMLPEGTDLATLAASFTAASAGATYSPLDKRVLVLGGQSADNPSAPARDESLITHEYVHALQDQHFDLLKLLAVRPYNFDRAEAAFAVVEGDAMNVQRRREQSDAVWSRRTLEEIARGEDARFGEYRREIGAFFPPLLTETFIFRYRDGTRFVEAVRRKSGARGIDELFRRPPASSEQVLHTEKYFAGERPRETALDEARFDANNWKVAASTPLGELGVRGLLLKTLPATEAARAAAGWGGDRAYLFEREGSTTPLFVWKTLWDKPEEAAEFFRAYNAMRGKLGEQRDAAVSDPAQFIWRDNSARLTLVRLDTDQVIIIRGTEADARAALELTRK
ncbi:MAG TPA: hypothetical protein VGW12_04700 [Pyrinomonadaceae bacterium]|nr:hypothetical protein [Pyrinomonadaceae bacterium]